MMKTLKRVRWIAALLLAMAMLLTAVTGCQNSSGTTSAPTGSNPTGNASSGETGAPKQKKLLIGIPQSAVVTDYDNNSFTDYMEEKLGAEIEFQLFSNPSEAMNQLTLMCAGGDPLPDVLVGFSDMSGSMMYQYGEEGFFIDMKDLIDQYGTEFKAHMAALPQNEQDRVWDFITHPGTGEVFGLPTYSAISITDYLQCSMQINEQWLRTLGLEKPTNTQELYDVLVAFRDRDPNGNGRPDELPMLGFSQITYYILNAFVYMDNKYPFNITDGKIWYPGISDEYRQAMIFLKKLYDEKLIKFDVSLTDMKSTVSANGKIAKVGIWIGQPESDVNSSTEVLDQYGVLAPLADETGKGGYLVERPRDLLMTGHITKDCKDPELAMKFLDLCFEDGAVTRRRHGEKGKNWEWSEEARSNIYGTESHIMITGQSVFVADNVTWGSLLPSIYTDYNYLTVYDAVEAGSFRAEVARILIGQMELINTWKRPEETIAYLKLTLDERKEREEINGKIFTTNTQYFSQFMSGKKDLANDKDWKEYLDKMEACGLSRLTAIYQAAYDRSK